MNIAWNPHDKNLNLTQRAEISFRHTGPKPWSAPLRPIYLQFKPNKPAQILLILYTLQVSQKFRDTEKAAACWQTTCNSWWTTPKK